MAKSKTNVEELEIFEKVPQAVLLEILRMEDRARFLRESVKESLRRGAPVDQGICDAEIRKTSARRPAWKDVASKFMSQQQMDEVIANTRPTESESLFIGVKKGEMAPEGNV